MPEAGWLQPTCDETLDTLLRGRIQLLQSRRGYRTSVDAMALAYFAVQDIAVAPQTCVDLGAGSGLVAILIGRHLRQIRLELVETQPDLAARAGRNLVLNGLAHRAHVHLHDVAAGPPAIGPTGLLVCNPPYYQTGARVAPRHPERHAAHCETTAPLERFTEVAAALLQPGGTACFVYPTEGRVRLVAAIHGAGLGNLEFCSLYHREGDVAPIRVLVRARQQARPHVIERAPVFLHPAGALDHTYDPAIESFLSSL